MQSTSTDEADEGLSRHICGALIGQVGDWVFGRSHGLSGPAYSTAFRAELSAIGSDASTAGSVLNRLLAQ